MPAKAFFDTNILIYAIAENNARTAQAEELLSAGGVLSVQILNEFASVARRKLRLPWKDLMKAPDAFRVLCPSPLPLTIELQELALKLSEELGYGIYDALVIAAALEADCTTLYSEDLGDGQVIHRQLTIRNPFPKSKR